MFQRFSLNFAIFSVLVDALIIDGVLWLVAYYRPLFNVIDFAREVTQPIDIRAILFVIFPFVWIFIMAGFDVYNGKKNFKMVDEFSSLTWSSILASVAMAGVLYLSYREVSRVLFIAFILIAYLCFLMWRLIARSLYHRRGRAAGHYRQVLIVGRGVVGLDVAERVKAHEGFGLKLAGFLDDDPEKQKTYADIFNSLGAAREIILDNHIDDVVITLPPRAHEKLSKLIAALHDTPVRIWLIPDYFDLALHHAEVGDFAGLPVFDLRAPALSQTQRWVKRIFDLIVTLLLMIILLPIMMIVAVIIYLDDGRPVFFSQKRIGENGRAFKMLKFRTMIRNADKLQQQMNKYDENGNLIHKNRDDLRVTRAGKWLRKYSLDELPQFFNVLRGTMSLIGPRPELPFLVEKYEPWQRKRFSVPQGITGWWQIHGRSDKPMHLHTEDDIYYIQNYSVWLDIQILIRTVWVVLRGKGAY